MKNRVTDLFCSLSHDYNQSQQSNDPCSNSSGVRATWWQPHNLIVLACDWCMFASRYCLTIIWKLSLQKLQNSNKFTYVIFKWLISCASVMLWTLVNKGDFINVIYCSYYVLVPTRPLTVPGSWMSFPSLSTAIWFIVILYHWRPTQLKINIRLTHQLIP
jgi:hypothetical protein